MDPGSNAAAITHVGLRSQGPPLRPIPPPPPYRQAKPQLISGGVTTELARVCSRFRFRQYASVELLSPSAHAAHKRTATDCTLTPLACAAFLLALVLLAGTGVAIVSIREDVGKNAVHSHET